MLKSFFLAIVVLLLSFWAIKPLFMSGFFPMHDNTQVARVFEMSKSLHDGMIPVRWVEDLGYGYGYPIFNFYAPLAYYVGALFTFLFLDSLAATKIMIILGILLSGISMYLLAKQFWGNGGGILSSLLYVYAPYHAVDVYVRGDIAELWAYGFLPIVALGIYKIFFVLNTQNKNQGIPNMFSIWSWVIVGSVGFAGVILSHNLTAFMIVPFLVVFEIVLIVSSRYKLLTTCYLLLTTFLGIGVSAFYSLPVIAEMKYTNVLSQVGGGADFHQHFVCIGQLWQSAWGYGGSAPGCVDGFSFMIGKAHIFLTVCVLVISLVVWKRTKQYIPILLITFIFLFLSIIFMLPLSAGIWEKIPYMAFVQYPWRYLLLSSFFTSFLAGGVVAIGTQINQRIATLLLGLILIVVILFNAKYFTPQKELPVISNFYTNNRELIWDTSKISDEYMPQNFSKPKSFYQIPTDIVVKNSEENISLEESTTQQKHIVLALQAPQTVTLRIAPFPAWKAYDNGKEIPVMASTKGIQLLLSQGKHDVFVVFKQTPIEVSGNLISLISIGVLILGILYRPTKIYL